MSSLVTDILTTAFEQVEKTEMLGKTAGFKLTSPSTKFNGVFVDDDRAIEMVEAGYSEEDYATLRATRGQFTGEVTWENGIQRIVCKRDGAKQWWRVRSVQTSGIHYEFKLQRIKDA